MTGVAQPVEPRQRPVAQPAVPSADEDILRARTYGLLGNLLAAPPGTEVLTTLSRAGTPVVASGEAVGSADESPAESPGPGLRAAWNGLAEAARGATADAVSEEYHALFIGLGRGELIPYTSWYLTGSLAGVPLARLRGDLISMGFGRRPGVHEPEDHAAALCEVMAMLVGESEGGADLAIQKAFYKTHLAPWMGRFFSDLQTAPSASFYKAVGTLGSGFNAMEAEYFTMSV